MSGTTTAAGGGAWYDLQPNFGGIGAGPLSGNPSDADQIAVGDTLTIHFSVPTELLGVATLFSANHAPFGTGFADGFGRTIAHQHIQDQRHH